MVKAHAQPCFRQPLWREWGREKQPGRMIEETQRVSVHRGREGGREPRIVLRFPEFSFSKATSSIAFFGEMCS